MRKSVCKLLGLALLFGSMSNTAYAFSNSPNKVDEDIQICQSSNQYSLQNELKKEIDQKMHKYYKKYSKELIDLNNLNNLDKSKQEEIENILGGKNKDNLTRSSSGSSSDARGFKLNFKNFHNGSIILVHRGKCPYGYWRHVGTYSESKQKFLTAQISDSGYGSGVIYEPKEWYTRSYDEAVGVNINSCSSNSNQLNDMMNWLSQFIGKDYSIIRASKSLNENDLWYCSLIPWKGYKNYFNVDIDSNQGRFVAPDDIIRFKSSTIIAKSQTK
ncbi:hypothetical protein IRP63_07095 [Clostridium botulinum]|uniref:hypothetical protein n=1 Tax=Clostridium botulinum TaxID=1491 RepID=UPI0006A4B752|nr:hypothetical protein [Clostridium botulinum]KOC52283.1 hypothetical protein ADU89_12015 [Clostridium botulinum]KOC56204.1 hypothetical protein ADU90_08750 [Clostridium botulinum]MCD3235050.1 hypothetical protein [Clostridium botulinum D/C]MCD3240977.1 hypothetical protein [Clostridium botulinum D/C]MCD3268418.1 hypothetical protein [Clostridium botulinum D/C]